MKKIVEKIKVMKTKLLRRRYKIKQSPAKFIVSLEHGLSTQQVSDRFAENNVNRVTEEAGNSYLKIIRKNVFTFFNMLLVIAAIIFVIGGAAVSKYLFLLFVLLNLSISTFQEIKAKRTIDKLTLIDSPKTRVLRNGKYDDVNSSDIVLDDIIALNIGDIIPADAVLAKGFIETNESFITGESDLIRKNENDKLLGGSFVVSGSCLARVTAVGSETYINKIQAGVKNIDEKKSVMMLSLNRIIKVITLIMIPVIIIQMFYGASNILAAGALITTVIPSGLILLVSVVLALGSVRLLKHKTMIKNPYAIEAIARIDTLCLDKTGTITDGTMSVVEVIPFKVEMSSVDSIMGNYLNVIQGTNQTSIALTEKFKLRSEYRELRSIGFSSQKKMSAVEFEGIGTFVLGAPEFILDSEKHSEILDTVTKKAGSGFRVICLAKTKHTNVIQYDNSTRMYVLGETEFNPIALFVIRDNIRKEAKDTIEWFNENDVAVKVISGDNALTVSRIAAQVGIPDADKCISLEDLSPEETRDAAKRFTVFGRVSPEQKAILVKALQDDQHNVAMTGDGVNDILALKTANCSIAMASGQDACKSVAQIVLLDSNFASLPKAVSEGRRAINNVKMTSILFLMKTIFTLFVAISSLFLLSKGFPFSTENFYILESVIIGFGSFALALQPNKDRITNSFLRTIIINSVTSGLLLFIPVLICFVLIAAGVIDESLGYPMSVCLMLISAYTVLFIISRPFNKYKITVFSVALGAGVVMLLAVPDLILMPGYLEANGLTDGASLVTNVYESITALFKGNLISNSEAISAILDNPGSFIMFIVLIVLSIPLYYALSKIVHITTERIEKIKNIE